MSQAQRPHYLFNLFCGLTAARCLTTARSFLYLEVCASPGPGAGAYFTHSYEVFYSGRLFVLLSILRRVQLKAFAVVITSHMCIYLYIRMYVCVSVWVSG